MTSEHSGLTSTSLIEAATEFLQTADYHRADQGLEIPGGPPARVFEDLYGIVGLVAYERWTHLVDRWPDAQATLVELMSSVLERGEPKSWEGYLVLLTPETPTAGYRSQLEDIQANTRRLRKLVGSGAVLHSLDDVGRVLRPILPLEPSPDFTPATSPFEIVPTLLTERGVDEAAGRALVSAFEEQRSLMEALKDAING